MAFRNDLDALAARAAALDTDLAQLTRERDRAAAVLAEARAQAARPLLDHIRVATPCRADWENMCGDDRVRHCGACDKNVYNLSAMTRDEAEAIIIEHESALCLRYFRRADGTIMTKDCAVGVHRRRTRAAIAVGMAATLAGTVLAHEWAASEPAANAPIAVEAHPDPAFQRHQGGYTMGASGYSPPPEPQVTAPAPSATPPRPPAVPSRPRPPR